MLSNALNYHRPTVIQLILTPFTSGAFRQRILLFLVINKELQMRSQNHVVLG
jgi:hypothetical protein